MTRDRDERQLRVMMHDLADLLVVVVPPAPPDVTDVALRSAMSVGPPAWGRRTLLLAAAALLVVALIVVARRPGASEPAVSTTNVELGSVDDFEVGNVTRFDEHDLFVVNDPTAGLLALSTLSPYRPLGCDGVIEIEDYDRHVYGQSVGPILENSRFIDTCTTFQFDLAGKIIYGPGPVRGMFGLDLTIDAGKVVVETDLLHPGARHFVGGVADQPIERTGDRDGVTAAIEGAVDAVADTISIGEMGPRVFVLGAFHAGDAVVVPVMVNDAIGTLTISDAASGSAASVRIATAADDAHRLAATIGTADGREIRLDLVVALDPRAPSDTEITRFMTRLADSLA
jgi:hypothetical protein